MAVHSGITAEQQLNNLAKRVPENLVDAAARLLGIVGENRGKAAFAARALEALADLAERMDEAALVDAAGAPSNVGALIQALEQPEALVEIRRKDRLGPARVRGLRAQEWILQADGGILTAEEIGRALGLTRQGVDRRRKHGVLIGLDLGRRGYAYPAWQAGPKGTLPGLPAVLAELRNESPWAQAAFFLTANVWLDGDTPLVALRRGETERVLNAARLLGDQVAV